MPALSHSIPLARPRVGDAELRNLHTVIESGKLSIGPFVKEFEQRLVNRPMFAAAVSSGTLGLELALRTLNFPKGSRIATPSFSFIASANAIANTGNVPVFVDIEPSTYCIDAEKIPRDVVAVLGVDVFGRMADWEALRKANRLLIADACESLGSERDGIRVGSSMGPTLTVLAFYPNKQITTGEGGAVLGSEYLVHRVQQLRNQGRAITKVRFFEGVNRYDWLHHEEIGTNARMSELNAAVGCAQLDQLSEILATRRAIAGRYSSAFSEMERVRPPMAERPRERISWFVYPLYFPDAADRELVEQALAQSNIETRRYFSPIHLEPPYRDPKLNLPVTTHVAERILCVPFYTDLSREDQERVIQVVINALA